MGGAALDYVADADDAAPSAEGNMPSVPEASSPRINTTNLSKDYVRWAQVELRNLGLYNDSLDGVMAPETKRALAEFQKANDLKQTAMLDQHIRKLFESEGTSFSEFVLGRRLVRAHRMLTVRR